MKKGVLRKTLLTTLILVVLLAVLSTATYAWYSAINRAGLNSITFTASSGTLSSALKIGKTETSAESYLLLTPSEENLKPMIPKIAATVGETTFNEFLAFTEAYEKTDEDGNRLVSKNGVDCEPVRLMAEDSDKFYVINTSESEIKVKVSYSITSSYDIASKVRIALFEGGSGSTAVLRGIFHLTNESGDGIKVHYGNLTEGGAVKNQPYMTGVYRASGEVKMTFAANEAKSFMVIVWFDGCEMQDVDGDKVTDEETGREENKSTKLSIVFEDDFE